MSTPKAKPPRATRRRGETRRRLLDAALEVFAEQGFGRASVEDVCTRAGYTRGAFYSNFVSLDELFLAMWQERSDADLAEIESLVDELEEHPVASLEEGVERWLEGTAIDEAWIRIQSEFTAHALRTAGLREVMVAREARIAELLLRALDRALTHVGRRATDPDAFAAALVAVHDGTAVQVLMEPDSELAKARRRDLFLAVVHTYTEVDPDGQP
jgi:AcrR family transcriptional regulator